MSTCLLAKANITIVEGGTFDKTWQWKVGDPAVVKDLTGYVGRMMIRAKLEDAVPLLTLENQVGVWAPDATSGIYILTPLQGIYKMYVTEEDTTGLCAEHKDIEGVYDLFLTSPDDEAVLKMYGTCKILAAVTR